MIKQERKCGLKHDRHTKARCNERNERLMKIINADTIIDDGRLFNIKVIVHICYHDVITSDINEDVDEMIATLNRDYNNKASNFNNYGKGYTGKNGDMQKYKEYIDLAGSANIHFSLNKIVCKKLDLTKYSFIEKEMYNDGSTEIADKIIKTGLSPSIDSDKNLNIWIVDGLGGGLLGYSSFPWDYSDETKMLDGVVINKNVFGKHPKTPEYNLNKTITHEVGHWFGLFHVFQDTLIDNVHRGEYAFNYKGGKLTKEETEGDCIEDTPYQSCATYGDPFSDDTLWKCSKYKNKKSWHMFMNFMDYVDDKSMFMFTKDQVKKLRLMTLAERPNIIQ
jgi:hypothetical protein